MLLGVCMMSWQWKELVGGHRGAICDPAKDRKRL